MYTRPADDPDKPIRYTEHHYRLHAFRTPTVLEIVPVFLPEDADPDEPRWARAVLQRLAENECERVRLWARQAIDETSGVPRLVRIPADRLAVVLGL